MDDWITSSERKLLRPLALSCGVHVIIVQWHGHIVIIYCKYRKSCKRLCSYQFAIFFCLFPLIFTLEKENAPLKRIKKVSYIKYIAAGCGSGGRAGRPLTRKLAVRSRSPSIPRAEVSLGKVFNPYMTFAVMQTTIGFKAKSLFPSYVTQTVFKATSINNAKNVKSISYKSLTYQLQHTFQ